MSNENDVIKSIVKSIRDLSHSAKKILKENEPENYHVDLQEIIGMVLYNEAFPKIDWNKTSSDLHSNNWTEAKILHGKSTNDLRAIMYNHVRNERFSRGHIQQLAASGYFDKWADALEKST